MFFFDKDQEKRTINTIPVDLAVEIYIFLVRVRLSSANLKKQNNSHRSFQTWELDSVGTPKKIPPPSWHVS